MRGLGIAVLGGALVLPCSGQDNGSLFGVMQDVAGARIPGVTAELHSEAAPMRVFRSKTDGAGEYRFAGLPAGGYTLELSHPGFVSITINPIHLSAGERKAVPPLEMEVEAQGSCGTNGRVHHISLLPGGTRVGNLGGSVMSEAEPGTAGSGPVAGADVTLICAGGRRCGTTKTNSRGEYTFWGLLPGTFSVRIDPAGFYPIEESDHRVQEGRETVYWPVKIEACHLGNCDPKLRPEKPLTICQ
jgi:hypothetical protein